MRFYFFVFVFLLFSCQQKGQIDPSTPVDQNLMYKPYEPASSDLVISRAEYQKKLQGFWLGQCIANWTGIVTELDKVGAFKDKTGMFGDINTMPFYTREDWGKPDLPRFFGGEPSELSPTIDFVFENEEGIWGADDDTDVEYMYQHLVYTHQTSMLSGEQIRDGWLKHIIAEEENYLWVSNQSAFDLMKEGVVPPETSDPEKNPNWEQIDAQLTTEIFGFFAPGRPDKAVEMAYLPIRTTARKEAAWISEYHVILYSLASMADPEKSMKENIHWMADEARKHLPNDSYPAKMYDFVKQQYQAGVPWEQTRDSLNTRYQINMEDGYTAPETSSFCNGCVAAGINFAAGIVSLLYGEGDYKETVKIGTLSGWDSDNPTATWGGLIGFMIGTEGIEKAFNRTFSDQYYIHRTRQNFENEGMDDFVNMANIGLYIVDRAVQEELGGGVDLIDNVWYIPQQ